MVPSHLRRRLEPMRAWDWPSWGATALIVLIAALLRFVRLGFPPSLVFDEVYYATEGQELL